MIPPQVIDTLNIKLPIEAILVPSLEGIRTIQSDWGTTITGNYRNLRVSRNKEQITISGSLQKFNRSESLTFEECKEAIYNLCETFSFDPKEALIKRIDIAKTFKTQHEPKLYYTYLGDHRSYFRSPFKNSLNYSNSVRALSFYDKGKEQSIPGNLLRYEQKYLKPDLVFKRKLNLAAILTEEVYNYFLTNWRSDYHRITKIKTIIPMENIKTPSELFNYLIAFGLNGIGNDLLSNQLKIAQRSGTLSKQNAKRIRDKIKRLSKESFFESNSMIEELNKKINSTID